MLNTLTAYIHKMLQKSEQPQTYGSALEAYIVSKKPTSTADVEHWTKEFDKRQADQWSAGGFYGR